MSDFKILLKVLKTQGYPNQELLSISKMINYNIDNFLTDLVDNFGMEKSMEFVKNSINKLSEGEKGIRINLNGYDNSYVYLKIKDFYIDLYETEDCILIYNYNFLESNFVSPEDGISRTLADINDDLDMSDMNEYDEFITDVQNQCSSFIHKNCGFYLWYD